MKIAYGKAGVLQENDIPLSHLQTNQHAPWYSFSRVAKNIFFLGGIAFGVNIILKVR